MCRGFFLISGHKFAFDRTSILGRQNNYNKILFHEMIEVKKVKNCTNRRADKVSWGMCAPKFD